MAWGNEAAEVVCPMCRADAAYGGAGKELLELLLGERCQLLRG